MTDQIEDLRNAYLFIADREQTLPSDVSDKFGHNMRYSRELIGALMEKKLVVLDTSTDLDFYSAGKITGNPLQTFDKVVKVPNSPAAGTDPKVKPAKKAAAKPATKEYHPCGCGCGENVPPKSSYRPGHDARHAGAVGREIAARVAEKGFDRRTLLAALPSDKLKAKAEKVAETAITKAAGKSTPAVTKEVEGIVTVGKTEYAAVKTGDKVVRVDTGKPVSAAAAKSFVEG